MLPATTPRPHNFPSNRFQVILSYIISEKESEQFHKYRNKQENKFYKYFKFKKYRNDYELDAYLGFALTVELPMSLPIPPLSSPLNLIPNQSAAKFIISMRSSPPEEKIDVRDLIAFYGFQCQQRTLLHHEEGSLSLDTMLLPSIPRDSLMIPAGRHWFCVIPCLNPV